MTEKLKKTLAHSPTARWTVLIMVSLTMMFGYYLCDVMAPLKEGLMTQFFWSDSEYGVFNSSYGWLNVFFVMIILSGIVLDKIGPRKTGLLAVLVMIGGIALKVYALMGIEPGHMVNFWLFGERTLSSQVLVASIGFAIFAVGYETMGITASKIIVRWFKPSGQTGIALGFNVALARIGSAAAMFLPIPLAKWIGDLSAPVYIGLFCMCIGLLTFIVFMSMDKKLDKDLKEEGLADDEKFRFSDIKEIFRLRGFWLMAMICVFFYSSVFPFVKYATDFIGAKYSIDEKFVGLIPSLLPLCAMVFTPFFGNLYDKRGHGVTMMIVGSIASVVIFVLFSVDALNHWWMASALILLLGIAFSLVPSVIWPGIANVVPQQRLGTAYAMTVWIQNLGMTVVPVIAAMVLEKYGTVVPAMNGNPPVYDFTELMLVFATVGALAVLFGVLFKREDRIKRYGIENHTHRTK